MGDTKAQDYNIPFDLITSEILSRLSVKTLLRCSVVCKSWYSLLINPSFITTHLNLSKSRDQYFVNFDCRSCCIISQTTHILHEKFDLPTGISHSRVVGSCNGLLCLRICHEIPLKGVIFLYNPSVRKSKLVDDFRDFAYYEESLFLYGFGYNDLSADHRIIRVKVLEKPKDFTSKEVEVYSLTTNSWHEVQEVPPGGLVHHCSAGLYLNGAVHWLTKSPVDDYIHVLESIVSFDFNKEVFKDMILPRELQQDMDHFLEFSELKGSLALLLSGRNSTYYLWVMSVYGVSESWTNKFVLNLKNIHRPPLSFTKNGAVVVQKLIGQEKRVLGLHEIENNVFKEFRKFSNLKPVVDFTESLFLLDVDNAFFKNQSDLLNWDLWREV